MGRRKTHAEFVAEVEELVGNEYTVLGEYKNNKTKIKMKHNSCSSEYEVPPDRFLRGGRCSKCAGNKKKTTELFKQEVFELVGNEYSVLEEYKNSTTKIIIKHNKCSYEYKVRPHDFSSGSRCPKCFGKNKKTTESFKQEVFELVGDDYSVLEEYKNSKTKIKVRHNKCSNIYDVIPNNFLRGNRCQKCAGNEKKTTESFKQEVFELVGDDYSVLGEYLNSDTIIEIKHNECSHIYNASPNSFLQGHRCPKCSGRMRKSTEVFKQEVLKLAGHDYAVLGEYKNSKTKIKMKHYSCSRTYEVYPTDFLRGTRCPKCNESKGERQVADYLSKMRIFHVCQYKFEDCRNTNRLPFDFAIFDIDKSLRCLIEYDGEQHFRAVDIFGGEKGFKYRKHNDAIKTKYCADHNIPLIRIPYWDFDNIDEILTKELRKLGVIETENIAS